MSYKIPTFPGGTVQICAKAPGGRYRPVSEGAPRAEHEQNVLQLPQAQGRRFYAPQNLFRAS